MQEYLQFFLLNQKIKIMKKYLLFIGIDISKKWIDLAASFDGKEKQMHHKRFTNDVKGFDAMLKWLSQLFNVDLQSGALFCMEHTGVYTIPLCAYLEGKQLDYVLESALRIKRSIGIRRGKDDKADAKAIARYVFLNHKDLKVSILPAQVLVDLKNLLAYRSRLLKQLHAIKVSAEETQKFSISSDSMNWIAENSEHLVESIKTQLKQVHANIKTLIKGNQEINKVFDLVTSVKGIGLITGLQIIIYTNNFKSFDCSRKFACYIGIAPFHKKSGSSLDIQAKVSPLGHTKIKALLSNGIMAAIKYDKELKSYYQRKIAEGKNKYKVLNAVKNKLISRVFATVKRGTPYVELFNYA